MTSTSLLNNNSGASGSSAAGSAVAASSDAAATQDMFTKLLVAQIQNQDPLSPTDPTQFVNQLAQLSQTESLQNLSTLTSNNSSVLQSMQILALGAQVGSNVSVTGTSVNVATDKISGNITLADTESTTTLELTGVDGKKHDIELGQQAAGTVPFTIDPAALGLSPGTYSMAVLTSSNEDAPIDINGTLGSVRVSGTGSVVLNVSNVGEVAPSSITGFNGKPAN